MRTVADCLSYWGARLLGTRISDAQFRAALIPLLAEDDDLRLRFHLDQGPSLFIAPAQTEAVVAALRVRFPRKAVPVIAAADGACAHIFDLLGSGPTPLGGTIGWHADFKTGYRWDPGKYYTFTQRTSYPGGDDIKVPWELSRCQHFAWLGQAYWFTRNQKYAQEFVAQVTDWIEQNPPRFGVNWTCAMDVAIRAVNWLWGYHLLHGSPKLTDEFSLTIFRSLLSHGRHIMGNLEWSDTLTSNHYLSDISGLVYLGILLPQFREARRWQEFGLQELEKEMRKQVYADGADFEASTSYHRLATEMFLSVVILAQQNGHQFSQPFLERLERMLDFVMHITKPDGTVPIIGDADNGRLHRLKVWEPPEGEWVDFRYLLAIGAVVFQREDLAQAAGDQWQEAMWLLGEQAITFKEQFDARDRPPLRLGSSTFPQAGICVMRRDGDLYMILDAGPNGQNGNGGHAHNDTLSFELYAYDKTFICDPGTYVYTADYHWRNAFRSTAYHNTIVVDGQEMNRFSQRHLFQMRNDAIPTVRRWVVSDGYDLLDAEHSGYERLRQPVTHQRQVYFDKKIGFWIIKDSLTGEGEHQFDFYLHFAPMKLLFDTEDPLAARTACAHGANLSVVPILRDGLSAEIGESWVSYSYGTKVKAPVLQYSVTAHVPLEFITILFPMRVHKSVAEIRAIALPLLARPPLQWLPASRAEGSL